MCKLKAVVSVTLFGARSVRGGRNNEVHTKHVTHAVKMIVCVDLYRASRTCCSCLAQSSMATEMSKSERTNNERRLLVIGRAVNFDWRALCAVNVARRREN